MFRKFTRIFKSIIFTPPLCSWEKWLKVKGVDVKGRVNIDGQPTIIKYGNSSITICDGVTLQSNALHNEAGILHPCVLAATGGNIYIGEQSGMSGVLICSEKKVHIGCHVGLGANVTIYDTDHHPVNPYDRIWDDDGTKTKIKAVHIDDYAWIGANSMILKGVHIGKGAVVGAGSIVTCDVPDYTIFAGNPARFIRNIDVSEAQKQIIDNE